MPTKPRELTLPDPSVADHPDKLYHLGAEIGRRMKRSRRRLDIMSTLATGHLPWGVEWNPWLTRYGNEWIMCCGHVLKFAEAQAFVSAGLLTLSGSLADPFPNEHAKAADLVITKAGKTWLQRNWDRPEKAAA